ncbi:hypothetical protein PMIN01_08600, partial [Paraphaeosphaeria minitans]
SAATPLHSRHTAHCTHCTTATAIARCTLHTLHRNHPTSARPSSYGTSTTRHLPGTSTTRHLPAPQPMAAINSQPECTPERHASGAGCRTSSSGPVCLDATPQTHLPAAGLYTRSPNVRCRPRCPLSAALEYAAGPRNGQGSWPNTRPFEAFSNVERGTVRALSCSSVGDAWDTTT